MRQAPPATRLANAAAYSLHQDQTLKIQGQAVMALIDTARQADEPGGMMAAGGISALTPFHKILAQLPPAYFGMVMSLMTVFEAIGSGRSTWIRRFVDDLNAVFIVTIVMALSLLAVPYSSGWLSVAWLCVFSYAAGLSFPIQRQLLNDAIIDSRFRATLLSVESIIDRAACAWVAAIIGGFLQNNELDLFLILSSGITVAGMVILFLGMRFRSPRVRMVNE